MKLNPLQIWVRLRENFWFLPALMILGATVLAILAVDLDAVFGERLVKAFPSAFGTNPDGARTVLSTVAGSMISLAGVTFSITIVALSLASGQYTSRVLRNFMRDRANQIVLGVFVSIFVYCLVVLGVVRGGDNSFVPSISMTIGLGLGALGIGCLIFFIHHVATSIQASTIIHNISRETFEVIDTLYPDERGEEDGGNDPDGDRILKESAWTTIPSDATGYVQTVNTEKLVEWAANNRTVVRMLHGIGEFVTEGRPVVSIAGNGFPSAADVRSLRACFSVASFRTIEQDVAFGIRQLVDVSLKALSPGVNDTTTAVTCVNYLGAILERIGRCAFPGEVLRHNGTVRLLARMQTYRHLCDEAFHQIRQVTRDNVAVYLALLGAVESAVPSGACPERRSILRQHLEHIRQTADHNVKDAVDAEVIRVRHRAVADALREP